MEKKFFSKLFLIIGVLVLLPSLSFAQETGSAIGAAVSAGAGFGFDLTGMLLSPLGYAILGLTSLITMLTGVLLNAAIYFTVVEMASNIERIGAINVAWSTIRDVANMGFIFVLLWASIKLIIGQDDNVRQLIVNIIIAAILINFSLFFTKFAIDIANLLALTFYGAIVPPEALTSGPESFTKIGLSNAIMSALGVTTIFASAGTFEGAGTLFTISILSSVVLLITSFIFLAMALLLIIRYVVLIFVLILSPIAFVSGVLPGLDKIAKEWKDTLIGQAIFAPIFFLLMWVTVVVTRGISSTVFGAGSGFGSAFASGGENLFQSNAVITIINFMVIIGFLVASIITAKKYADMAPGGVSKVTKWAMGAAGGASLGLAGKIGRTTFGQAASATANDKNILDRAAKGEKIARLQLAASRKLAGSSFDIRATEAGGSLEAGKASGAGGYLDYKKKKAEEAKKYADSLAPSAESVYEAEQRVENAKTDEEKAAAQRDLAILRGLDPKAKEKLENEWKEKRDKEIAESPSIKEEKRLADEIAAKKKALEGDMDAEERIIKNEELNKLEELRNGIQEKSVAEKKAIDDKYNKIIEGIKVEKGDASRRKDDYVDYIYNKSFFARVGGYNTAAASTIRKSKSAKDKAIEALEALTKEDKKDSDDKPKDGEAKPDEESKPKA